MQLVKKMIFLLTLAAAAPAVIATPAPGTQTAEALPSFAVQGNNPHAQQHFAAPQSNFRHNFSNVNRFNRCMYPAPNTSSTARAAQCSSLLLVRF